MNHNHFLKDSFTHTSRFLNQYLPCVGQTPVKPTLCIFCKTLQLHKEMSVVVLPGPKIKFLDSNIHKTILTNSSHHSVLFKFQVNNIRLFCCKPVMGCIPPKQHALIRILFKWWKANKDIDIEQIHRFRLLSCIVPQTTMSKRRIEEYWTVSEQYGFVNQFRNDVIRYMDVEINWNHFIITGNQHTIMSYEGLQLTFDRDHSVSEEEDEMK